MKALNSNIANFGHLKKTLLPQSVGRHISETRMHSSRMRTDCSSSYLGGGGLTPPPPDQTRTPRPNTHPPPDQTRHPPIHLRPDTHLPQTGTTPRGQTDACENITFPASLCYEVGNYLIYYYY